MRNSSFTALGRSSEQDHRASFPFLGLKALGQLSTCIGNLSQRVELHCGKQDLLIEEANVSNAFDGKH